MVVPIGYYSVSNDSYTFVKIEVDFWAIVACFETADGGCTGSGVEEISELNVD